MTEELLFIIGDTARYLSQTRIPKIAKRQVSMPDQEGALEGVRIVDLTDERGIYGAKLLADLGADVVRPEPPEGDELRSRGPHLAAAPEDQQSLWHAFFASNRRFFSVDLSVEDGIKQLHALIDRATIVLTCKGAFGVAEAQLDLALSRRKELVVIDVSSFGHEGPWRDYIASELVAGALGGSAATTGDADTPPLKLFGELNYMVSGVYTAIAAQAGEQWQKGKETYLEAFIRMRTKSMVSPSN